jgi:alpha/beta superfamily hydrolase
MNAHTERLEVAGPAGRIAGAARPAGRHAARHRRHRHPHPLFGGTMDNKVVQTLARAFVQCGWTALRFNFRGVGASEGAYDEGRGEPQDLLALVEALAPQGPLALAGFSFGAFVTAQALQALWGARDIAAHRAGRHGRVALPGAGAAGRGHERTLVVHGEVDDTVPLQAVLDWARPQSLPVTVVPGVEHFFHGQLPLLKSLVVRHLRAQE